MIELIEIGDGCKDAVGSHSLRGYAARHPDISRTAKPTKPLRNSVCHPALRTPVTAAAARRSATKPTFG
jgi:hypothetical protein